MILRVSQKKKKTKTKRQSSNVEAEREDDSKLDESDAVSVSEQKIPVMKSRVQMSQLSPEEIEKKKAAEEKQVKKIDELFSQKKYTKASKYIAIIPQDSEALLHLAQKFTEIQKPDEALKCYIHFSQPEKAVETALEQNQIEIVEKLIKTSDDYKTDEIVFKTSQKLIERNAPVKLLQVLNMSYRYNEASLVLKTVGQDFYNLKLPPKILKKIYVLSALELEKYKQNQTFSSKKGKGEKLKQSAPPAPSSVESQVGLSSKQSIVPGEFNNMKELSLNNPWREAEAMHFYMLCQQMLYQEKYREALRCAYRLTVYEKILGTKAVYSLIALSALLSKSFIECSRAMTVLENMKDLSKTQRKKYQELSLSLFEGKELENLKERFYRCPNKGCDNDFISEYDICCNKCGLFFDACLISGRSILTKEYFKCRQCKHKTLKKDVLKKMPNNCPLCHLALMPNKSKAQK